MTIKGFWTFFCLWLSLHDEKSWTRCLICIIPCLCICICICLRPCLFLAVSQFSKMINLRCAALYALFLAQGQAAVYQGVLISTQCILIFSNFNIFRIPSMHCFLRKGKLGCCVPWSFNQQTMHFHDEVEKGRSCMQQWKWVWYGLRVNSSVLLRDLIVRVQKLWYEYHSHALCRLRTGATVLV